MRIRLILIGCFLIWFVFFGKKQYIQCYNNLVIYKDCCDQLIQLQSSLDTTKASLEEKRRNFRECELSMFDNRYDLVNSIGSIQGCSIDKITAMHEVNEQSNLTIAVTDNLEDVLEFTDKVNLIQLECTVIDVSEFLEELSRINCLIKRVIVDNESAHKITVLIVEIKE